MSAFDQEPGWTEWSGWRGGRIDARLPLFEGKGWGGRGIQVPDMALF